MNPFINFRLGYDQKKWYVIYKPLSSLTGFTLMLLRVLGRCSSRHGRSARLGVT